MGTVQFRQVSLVEQSPYKHEFQGSGGHFPVVSVYAGFKLNML